MISLSPQATDHFHSGSIVAVHDVMRHQQVRGRDAYGSDLVQGDDRKPEFVVALEDQHHPITFFDSQTGKVRSRPVALAFDVGKSEVDLFLVLPYP